MKKILTWWVLIWFGMGAVIGTGIFVLMGLEEKGDAGPAVVLSYVVSGASTLMSFFCYTKFVVEITTACCTHIHVLGDGAQMLGFPCLDAKDPLHEKRQCSERSVLGLNNGVAVGIVEKAKPNNPCSGKLYEMVGRSGAILRGAFPYAATGHYVGKNSTAYVHAEFLDEYMQMSERSSRLALDHFCQSVMQIYGPEYLRKPTVTDVEKLYLHHEEKHGFSGMLGSLDCTDWEWFACPYAFKAQYVRRDHGPNPFILLEVVASQDLWIWHAFFGVAGSNNDINVLYQSPLFNDLKTGRAPEIPFVANGVTYPSGYYLVDGIYPELAPLVKTIPELAHDDHKRILYKQKQESARKDV
ncbi:ALP1-like protein isoform X1 [Tanacetum coccineum]|uniref:ALP1-like protein isoform X1 n=1 Tax=Tanacetum coccineum TaxID=301880 RepID=A0ABQ4XEY8_9ASTR